MILFTQEELENLTKIQLRNLCKYYDIEVFRGWSRKRLIQEILEYQTPPGYVPIMASTRVERIRQSMKGEPK